MLGYMVDGLRFVMYQLEHKSMRIWHQMKSLNSLNTLWLRQARTLSLSPDLAQQTPHSLAHYTTHSQSIYHLNCKCKCILPFHRQS